MEKIQGALRESAGILQMLRYLDMRRALTKLHASRQRNTLCRRHHHHF